MPTGDDRSVGVNTELPLVRRLVATQFPEWADLAIEPVDSAGTDNAIYRLGGDMCIRLPRIDWAVEQVEKEHQWLPKLASFLPIAIPIPLAKGSPDEAYPWHWSIYRWLNGEDAVASRPADQHQAATVLAQFITALQRIDPSGGPSPGSHNSYRGVTLSKRDRPTRDAIASLRDLLDADAATCLWEEALEASKLNSPPVWIHGDLLPANLLIDEGRLSAVIDFGCLGVGDPACDLMVAYTFLSGQSRNAFRTALAVDDTTWARGRGWALSIALVALAYYIESNPVLAGMARYTIDEILSEFRRAADQG